MVRFRGVPRTKKRYEPQYKHAGLVPTTPSRKQKEVVMSTPFYQNRGRTLWSVFYEGKQFSLRASATAPHQAIRELLIEYLGYNPGDIMLVQAGGYGQFYDEADKQCMVDIDILPKEEEE